MGAPYRDSMPFTIQDVLNNLGLPVKAEKRGVLILDCPFCLGKNGQPDHHGHMEIDLARDRYRCHRCGRMGGKLDLYMAGHPNVLDAKQAYREMMEYLEGPRKGAPRFIPQALSLPPSPETEKRASVQQLHETYSALLEMLTLTSTHRQNLRDRGLEDGEIDRLTYRSVPAVGQRRLAAELLGAGCTLEGVPGFYLDDMHILHSILVHLSGDVPADEGESREEYLKRIRLYAGEETDEFYGAAYDRRKTATAGGGPANTRKMSSLVPRMGRS